MKKRKITAIFLSIAMFIVFSMPISVSAVGAPNLGVSIDTMDEFGVGNISLPIIIKNNDSTTVTIESIKVSGSFSAPSGSISVNKQIAAQSSISISLPTIYSGYNDKLSLAIKTTGNNLFNTTLIVKSAVPDLKDPNADIDPALSADSFGKTTLHSGDTVAFPMTVALQRYACDVRISICGEGDNANMFSFTDPSGRYTRDYLNDGETVTPTIHVSSSLSDGTYPVKIKFSYKSASGKSFTSEDSCNVTIFGKAGNYAFVSGGRFAKAQIGKDNKSKLNINIKNPITSPIYNISASFNGEKSKDFSLYENFRPVTIGAISAGGGATATFSVYVSSTVATGNYPLAVNLSYETGDGQIVTSVETIYVQVTRTPDSGTGTGKPSTPRIIVSKYSTDTKEIKAGQTFTLDFSLQNTSATTTVSNIKVVMGSATVSPSAGAGGGASAGGDVFFPAEGSNSFFISKITPHGSASNKIKLMARQDVEPGVYPVMLKLDYEDSAGNPLSSEEQVSFAVTQEQRLDVQGLNIPTDAPSGPIQLNFQYINKGKATIYNLSVSLEGDFSIEGGSQYIGNLVAGYNDYFDNVMTPASEGPLKGTIVLTYEDSSGNKKEQRHEFSCNVSPMDMDANGSMDPMLPPEDVGMNKTLKIFLWIGIPVLVAGAAALAVIIIMKKRKAKKELVEDEED